MERKLASIRRIGAIDPIPGADNIVCLTIDGWKLVSQKGNFKEGDFAVYFEVDSFLPVRPEFEFLRSRCFKSTTNLGDGFRLKTIKLRGQVSQGLALPMGDFFEFNNQDCNWYFPGNENPDYLRDGDDVTEYLGVQKYDKPIPSNQMGVVRGNFPSFIRKTDQERAQNCFNAIKSWIFEERTIINDGTDEAPNYRSIFKPQKPEIIEERRLFEASLKLDGSSMTVYHNKGQIGVCSRNLDLERDFENVFWRTAILSGILAELVQTGWNVAIQGELMGPGVQNNREEFKLQRMYVFDYWDIDKQRYLTPVEREKNPLLMNIFKAWYAEFDLRCQRVPIIEHNFSINQDTTIDDLLKFADRASINNKVAEGIVFKSHVPDGPSFKIINNKFLLAEKD